MKCKNGNDNMYLNKDECMWHCPHCGYEKFAPRTFYNAMKIQAKNETNKEKFVKDYDKCVQSIVERAWDKAHQIKKGKNETPNP
jgi:DNA-directed RNA polymerase subunit M/transcription elongation factor TFIIS